MEEVLLTMHHLSLVYQIMINNVVIDNAADLDVIVPMYNLLKYIENYKKNNRKFVELLQG